MSDGGSGPRKSFGGGTQPPKIGSYRLLVPLGSGGMSNVYRAIHEESGSVVAVKVLPRNLARNSIMLRRFLQEAKIAEALIDPHIVEILDRGCERGLYYIVLEYLPGGDLQEWVKTHGPMPVHTAVDVIKGVARGLRHAASVGLIHRDIKPANLLLTADGRVKITDMGLARQLHDEDDERVTRDGTTVGTVDYMAPEQARDSRATSVRSDIYSLGCTLYFLLTGEPPFVGGEVTEKLRKHASETPPNVRAARPDVPVELAQLMQSMMAKAPAQRFQDYDKLLKALDDLPVAPPDQVFDALIDDDRATKPRYPDDGASLSLVLDSEKPLPVPPTMEWWSTHPAEKLRNPDPGHTLDDIGFVLGKGTGSGAGAAPPSTKSMEMPRQGTPTPPTGRQDADFGGSGPPPNLKTLASAEREAITLPSSPKPRPSAVTPVARPDASAAGSSDSAEGLVDVLVPDPQPVSEMTVVDLPAPRATRQDTTPQRTRVLQALAALVLVALLGVAVQRVLEGWSNRAERGGAERQQPGKSGFRVSELESGPGIVLPREPLLAIHNAQPQKQADSSLDPGSVRVWQEPVDGDDPRPAPRTLDPEDVEALQLTALMEAPAPELPTPTIQVRRVVANRGRELVDRLRKGLDALSGTVEIADDGPLYEQDWRFNGSPRVVRAAAGFRPSLVLERATLQSVRSRPAVVVLDGKRLTLAGLDLVIRAEDLLPQQTAVFLLLGPSELVLRDCTVTVVGQIGRPFALIQVGQGGKLSTGRSVVRLERSRIRLDDLTVVHLAEGPAGVGLIDTLAMNGRAPVLVASGDGGAGRTTALVRAGIVTAGGLIELAGSAAGPEVKPMPVRVLESAILSTGEPQMGGLVAWREASRGGPRDGLGLDWNGRKNLFAGWTKHEDLTGNEHQVVAPDLAALRSLGAQETQSESRDDPPIRRIADAWSLDEAIRGSTPRLDEIARIAAAPRAGLRERTLGSFAPRPITLMAGSSAPAHELDFDADAEPWAGDLGRYLAEQVPHGASHVRVRVRGAGLKWSSPFRLRDGFTLEVDVQQPDRGGLPPLVWRPVESAEGAGWIVCDSATLVLRGARLERDARSALKSLLHLKHGNLTLENCWLTAPSALDTKDPAGGRLITFETDGTRPIEQAGRPDRPTALLDRCVLLTGGEALALRMGRGSVVLKGCALAAGSAAFVLEPEDVARGRFEVDLSLDRCTVIAERDVVRLGAWSNPLGPPARPWVVHTRACVFLDPFDRGTGPSTTVLVRGDEETLARGLLAWQSERDAFGLRHDLMAGPGDPTPLGPRDVRQGLSAYWGAAHVVDPGDATNLVQLAAGKLAPGEFQPDDLRLTPQRGAGALTIGADPDALGLATAREARQRRVRRLETPRPDGLPLREPR